MAQQLQLITRADLAADSAAYDLLPLLNYDGWDMMVGDGETPIDEAMQLHFGGTSDDNLASNLHDLLAVLEQVKRYANPTEKFGVWLRHQMPGESGARQALVLRAAIDRAALTNVLARDHYLRTVMLGLQRTSAWEDPSYTTFAAEEIESLGGVANLGAVQCDIAARLAQMTINASVGLEALSRVWIGFRTDLVVNTGNFVPRWEAELGHFAANVAITDASDATATGGTEIEYAGEVPVLADDAFGVLHTPVKPTSITLTATIAAVDYTLTDASGDGYLVSTPSAATDEEVDPGTSGTLDHPLIVPGSLLFKDPGDDTEIAHDDGAGNLVYDEVNVGTINYATGAWTTSDSITAAADYEYGFVEASIDYRFGICTFTTLGVTAVVITYTSYEDRSVRVTFTSPTMQWRWYADVSDITANPTDQAGKMLVLARMKVSDGSTICRVRLETGYDSTASFATRPRVAVSGTDWNLYPLGYVSFPESGRDDSLIDAQRVRLAMERYSGTGTLDLDHLIMVPADNGFVSVEGESGITALVTPLRWPIVVTHSADDQVTVIGTNSSGVPIYSDVIAQVIGGLPIGSNVYAIMAAQRQTVSNWYDTIDLTINAYKRWRALRGAE